MNESAPPPPGSDHDSLRLRHVLGIVLFGAALGVGFNALQLSSDSGRGLAWVKSERRVVSLGGLPRTAPVAPADTARSAGAPARPREATAPAKPARPAHAAIPAPVPVPAPATPAAAPSAPAVAPPQLAAGATAPAPDLPVIPDSRDPIEVGLDVAQKFHASGAALFLDARSAQEYAEGHVAGAVSLPFDDVYRNPALAKAVEAKGRVLITYCGGGDCDLSRNLAFSLIDSGFRKVLVFKDGLPAWVSAGAGVHRGVQP
jgi:rhodanese-related sulfurtransferase